MPMEQLEFEFPDEKETGAETKVEAKQNDIDFQIRIHSCLLQ